MLHDALRELAQGRISRLDHLHNLEEEDATIVAAALEMLEAGEKSPAGGPCQSIELRKSTMAVRSVFEKRERAKQEKHEVWRKQQVEKRKAALVGAQEAALTRIQLDREMQREQGERSAMGQEDADMRELYRLWERRANDVTRRAVSVERAGEQRETESMAWEERDTREILRFRKQQQEKLLLNKQEFAKAEKDRADIQQQQIEAVEAHSRLLLKEEERAERRAGREVEAKKAEEERLEKAELRGKERRERETAKRKGREKDRFFKKKMRERALGVREERWRKMEEEQARELDAAKRAAREEHERKHIEELRQKWNGEKEASEAQEQRVALRAEMQRQEQEEKEMQKRELWKMRGEEDLVHKWIVEERKARRREQAKVRRMIERQEGMERAYMEEEEVYERKRLDLMEKQRQLHLAKKRMAEKMERERLCCEELDREERERGGMAEEELHQRDVLKAIKELHEMAEEKERIQMQKDECQVSEVWDMWAKRYKAENNNIAEKELRREWLERGKMGKEEKLHRKREVGFMLAIQQRTEVLEGELMGYEDAESHKQRLIELEGQRLLPLAWPADEAAIMRCLKNVDFQLHLAANVKQIAQHLKIPCVTPLPLHLPLKPEDQATSKAKHQWKVGLKKWKLQKADSPIKHRKVEATSADSIRNGEMAHGIQQLALLGKSVNASQDWLALGRSCFALWLETRQKPYITQAVKAYKQALQHFTVSSQAENKIEAAKVYELAGDLPAALSLLAHLIERRQEDVDINWLIFRAAVILRYQKEYKQSRAYFVYLTEAAVRGWQPAQLLFQLARVYELEGNREMAKLGYQQVYFVLKQDARVAGGWNRYEQYDAWEQWYADRETWEELAQHCIAREEYTLAIDFLQQTLNRLEPDAPREALQMQLAVACQRAHDVDGCRRAWAELLKTSSYETLLADRLMNVEWEKCGVVTHGGVVTNGGTGSTSTPPVDAGAGAGAGAGEAGAATAADWVEVDEGGVTYWWNEKTSETSWSNPLKSAEQAPQAATSNQQQEWKKVEEEGVEYWWNET
jgi:hypothetical protein